MCILVHIHLTLSNPLSFSELQKSHGSSRLEIITIFQLSILYSPCKCKSIDCVCNKINPTPHASYATTTYTLYSFIRYHMYMHIWQYILQLKFYVAKNAPSFCSHSIHLLFIHFPERSRKNYKKCELRLKNKEHEEMDVK